MVHFFVNPCHKNTNNDITNFMLVSQALLTHWLPPIENIAGWNGSCVTPSKKNCPTILANCSNGSWEIWRLVFADFVFVSWYIMIGDMGRIITWPVNLDICWLWGTLMKLNCFDKFFCLLITYILVSSFLIHQ